MYGNVRLTDSELAALRCEFPDLDTRIERLSEYIASQGDKYKNHAATIRAWSKNGRDGVGVPRPAVSKPLLTKPSPPPHESGFDTDEFFEAALRHSQRYMEGLRSG